MVERDRGGDGLGQPLLARAVLGDVLVVVAQRDAGSRRKPLDRVDEVEVLDVAHERDRVTASVATEAIARQDVVFEREGMLAGNERGVHLLDAVGRLDACTTHPRLVHFFVAPNESSTVLTEEEKVLREIFVDEVNTEDARERPTRQALA